MKPDEDFVNVRIHLLLCTIRGHEIPWNDKEIKKVRDAVEEVLKSHDVRLAYRESK